MKNSRFFLIIFLIIFSGNGWAQNKHKHPHNNGHFSQQKNISFTGALIAGLFLNELTTNKRQMYFVYNYSKKKWRLKRDVYDNYGLGVFNQTVVARFENPNGGRDFFVKINKRGNCFIDAPKRLRKVLKNKVWKHL